MPGDDLKYLATYLTRQEAETMKELLAKHDITCLLRFNEVGGSFQGSAESSNGPAELWVMAKDLELGHELIGKKGK